MRWCDVSLDQLRAAATQPAALRTSTVAPAPAPSPGRQTIGRVLGINGSQATIGLLPAPTGSDDSRATVGKFLSIHSGTSLLIGMITDVSVDVPVAARDGGFYATAKLDLMGEIMRDGARGSRFQRGVANYPVIGDGAALMTNAELRVIYEMAGSGSINVGNLQQDPSIGGFINGTEMVGKHFAMLGTTGVGKSSGVAIILQELLKSRPDLRIFLVDAHNEYGRFFGDNALVLTPRNVKLPFWLFNFEEIIDVLFNERSDCDEEIEILSDVIPLAKCSYTQYRGRRQPTGRQGGRPQERRLHDRHAGAIPAGRSHRPDRRAHGQAREPLVAHVPPSPADPDRDHPQRPALRLHVRQRQCRRRHHGGGARPAVPDAGQRQADDHHAARRLPVGGRRRGDVGALPHGVRLRPVERRRDPAAVRLRGGAPLCLRRPQHRLRPDPPRHLAHRQGGPQIRRLPRTCDAAAGRARPDHFVPVQHTVRDAASNDRDQALVRSAVSDAAASLLAFLPSLATREVFAFGEGVALPTRLKFRELPAHLRPKGETIGEAAGGIGNAESQEFIDAVVERWRGATMSHRSNRDDPELGNFTEPPPLQAALPDSERFRILKRPAATDPLRHDASAGNGAGTRLRRRQPRWPTALIAGSRQLFAGQDLFRDRRVRAFAQRHRHVDAHQIARVMERAVALLHAQSRILRALVKLLREPEPLLRCHRVGNGQPQLPGQKCVS